MGFGWGVWVGFVIAGFGGINPLTSLLAMTLGLCAMILSERTARTARKKPDRRFRKSQVSPGER
jgi:hypothetical protein